MPIPQAAHYMNCPLHELPITGVLLYIITNECLNLFLLLTKRLSRCGSLKTYREELYPDGPLLPLAPDIRNFEVDITYSEFVF